MAQPLKVWSKFSVTRETEILKFRLVEPPQDRIEDVGKLILNHFVKDEPLAKAAGIFEDEEAIAEYIAFMTNFMDNEELHFVICCLDNDNDEIGDIVGASVMALIEKEKKDVNPKTKPLQKFIEGIIAAGKKYDMLSEQGVEKFYEGRGVVVHSSYRGLGMAHELLKTRRHICREHGVPLTAALMTAHGTQKAAKRDGWETVLEFSLEDFGKELEVKFDKNDPPTAKLMATRV